MSETKVQAQKTETKPTHEKTLQEKLAARKTFRVTKK